MKADKYFNKIRKKVGHTLYNYQMLQKGDKVLVALSGGKDSLVMLETLSDCRKHIPFPIEIYACHVIATGVGYKIDKEYLEAFCSRLGVKLFFEIIHIDLNKDPKKHPCFVCSWHRRKKLFALSRNLECNKLAFGHHMDDAIETFFMNMVFHASLSSLPQKIDFFDGDITLIRPLLNLPEKEIIQYAELKKYKKELKQCDHENRSNRFRIKELIKTLSDINPNAAHNIFKAMDNSYPDYLPKS